MQIHDSHILIYWHYR